MPLPVLSRQLKCIAAIPVELWCEIFELALPSFDNLLRNRWGDAQSNAPVSISQTWRDIAIKFTPRIWTNILVEIAAGRSSSYTNAVITFPASGFYGIDLWVARSKHCPLSVYIEADLEPFGRPSQPVHIEQTRRIYSRLFQHMSRWKVAAFKISGITDDFLSYLESVFENSDTPLLETLVSHLRITKAQHPDGLEYFPMVLWLKSPQLRDLTIIMDHTDLYYYGGLLRWNASSGIPYKQLTSLTIEAAILYTQMIDVGEVIHIFRHAQNLVSCSITGITGPENALSDMPFDDRESISPVLSSHLQHLRISLNRLEEYFTDYGHMQSLPEMLSFLTAPSLTSLSLGYGFSWSQPHYSAFIHRSNFRLEELDLIATVITPHDFEECISLSPPPKRLHSGRLSGQERGEFARQMSQWNEDRQNFEICPNLEGLSLKSATTWTGSC